MVGVRATVDGTPQEIRADLVVGADGRHSTVRDGAGLQGHRTRRADGRAVVPPHATSRAIRRRRWAGSMPGSILVMLDRGDYWQCAFVHPQRAARRGKRARHRSVPRDASRARCRSSPTASHELASVDDLKLLTVGVDRLDRWWRPGVLCIGDAAHHVADRRRRHQHRRPGRGRRREHPGARRCRGGSQDSDLAAVQRPPHVARCATTRPSQVFLQNRMIAPTLAGTRPLRPPWPVVVLLIQRVPVPAPASRPRAGALGVQPEHVQIRARLAARAHQQKAVGAGGRSFAIPDAPRSRRGSDPIPRRAAR